MDTKLAFVGIVRSPYKTREECPRWADASSPESSIKIMDPFLPALQLLEPGARILVLTWLHQADRTVLRCHPRADQTLPLHGVFATRSPDRPNPIGLHACTLINIDHNILRVHPLEVMDGTPVLDIKPDRSATDSPALALASNSPAVQLIAAASAAWSKGLLNGFNGNVSLREGDACRITAAGTAKGYLTPSDFALLDIPTGKHLSGPPPSTEAKMHLAIYQQQPKARAVVHTHPPHLLALSLTKGLEALRDLGLFEADLLLQKTTTIPYAEPGTDVLAQTVGQAAQAAEAVFMTGHGLTVWAEDLVRAVAFSEELESLARIQLLTGRSA